MLKCAAKQMICNSSENYDKPLQALSVYIYFQMEKQKKIRFVILALTTLVMFGNNYAFDNPQALEEPIELKLNITQAEFNLLYTVFSIPNIVLTLVGGIVIDALGARQSVFVFTLSMVIAQLIISLGSMLLNFPVMLLGRAIFGISSEFKSIIITIWFRGQELATAMGIVLTVPEIASAMNSLITPYLYSLSGSLTVPLCFSVAICTFSFLAAFILVIIDRMYDQKKTASLLLDKKCIKPHSPIISYSQEIQLWQIKELPQQFWITLAISVLSLSSYIPFLDNANKFLDLKYGYSEVSAGRMIMITYFTAGNTYFVQPILVLASPIIGQITDKYPNKKKLIIIIASVDALLAHLVFAFIPLPQLGLFLLGLSYTFYSCAMISTLQSLVDCQIMGTALGLLGVFESISLSIVPVFSGWIYGNEDNRGLLRMSLFYVLLAMIQVLLSFKLQFVNKQIDSVRVSQATTEYLEMNKIEDNASFEL